MVPRLFSLRLNAIFEALLLRFLKLIQKSFIIDHKSISRNHATSASPGRTGCSRMHLRASAGSGRVFDGFGIDGSGPGRRAHAREAILRLRLRLLRVRFGVVLVGFRAVQRSVFLLTLSCHYNKLTESYFKLNLFNIIQITNLH